jgi:hypothetical protein
VVCWLILAAAALSANAAQPSCDARCERQAGWALLERGDARAAVERLRGAVAAFPRDPVLPLLLARAYLSQGNLFWGERTLRQALTGRPDDITLRAWLACVHLRQGDPTLAWEDLDGADRPAGGPELARWKLLETWHAWVVGDRAAAEAALAEVPRSATLYTEDRPQWSFLHRTLDPGWVVPIDSGIEMAVGHTSNALAGAPTDPGESGGSSSVARLELRTRLAPPAVGPRFVVDLDVLGQGLGADTYSELSTLDGSLRIGALLAGPRQRIVLGYRSGQLWLNQDESRFSRVNRLEVEVERESGLVALAGAGRREYRDARRTRWEGDVSLGGPAGFPGGVPVVVGGTIRAARASSPAYDQTGVAAAVAARVGLGRGRSLRLALAGSWDLYPRSGGAEGLLVFGTSDRRRDVTGRFAIELSTPVTRSLAAVIGCQFVHRDSTADAAPGFDFSYREARAVVGVRWRVTADPWAPRTVEPDGHVALDWGLEGGVWGREDSILDLLRQDEELRRGSSCALR